MGVLPKAEIAIGGERSLKAQYYAIYDVSDGDTRKATIQALKNAGFIRVQKSAFCGTLSPQEKKDLMEDVKALVTGSSDSFYLIQTCDRCFGKILVVGQGFDFEYAASKKAALVV